jgi:serine/threonine protein kinase/tetratricopeptide (TPR) repeat protein
MPLPVEKKILICEQCGSPLQSRPGEEDCLHCLLTSGLEPDETSETIEPNESSTRNYQHYQILTRPDGASWELGRGAMGVTYKARDLNLNTPVALKVINARFSAQPDARRRFLREAQSAACLRHPNVATVFHFGTINALPNPDRAATTVEENADAGDCFYAMEFVEGETLETRVRRDGPLTPIQAIEVALQVARALAAAEKHGLVHRDLKPSNIMLAGENGATMHLGQDQTGEVWVKVIDFGVAQIEAKNEPSLPTRFFGTLAFSSPEQIEARAVDGRSDIYSLGVTLWYALTGKVPFAQRSLNEPNGRVKSAPLRVAQLIERGVPLHLISLLESMLAPVPEDRPGSAIELGQVLQRSLDMLTGIDHPPSVVGRRRRWILTAAGLGLAAGLVALAIYLFPFSSAAPDKSIAVLPFRNLSNEPANAFFAEGVQDDLLSRLVKIHDLKVTRLGRPSAAETPRNLRKLGRDLGVRHVLEGSLRRTGDRVLLHVALVDTFNGNELWAESFDRRLADAINLQGELAAAIADALNATLSPQESVGIRVSSTRNPDAYVLYLRGRKFENSPTFAISDYEAAEALYTQAIAIDSGFALAHARLASTLALLYRFRGPSEELKKRAYGEAQEALRLQPELGEAHLVSALCAYRIDRDFERTLPELEQAKRLLPNDAEAGSFIAYIHRRRGEWADARTELENCLLRDPRNETYAEELYTTAYLLRDWAAAERHIKRAETLAPTYPILKVERALVGLWRDGNLAPLRRVFATIPSYGDPQGTLAWMRWDAAMIARDFPAAQAAIDGFPFETLTSVYSAPIPKGYLEGCIALARGDRAGAHEQFEAVRPVIEAEALAHPNNALRHARLGLLYSYMGRKEDAIREGKRAVELKPVAKDAFDGPEQLANLALIYAQVGAPDQAISLINDVLRMPGGVFFCEASMSWWELRLRWQWDPLRSDPRFQKILAAPEPQTVF